MPAPNLRTTAVIPCAVCEGQQITVLAFRDRHGQPLENVLCRACGLVWVDPRPSNQSLEKFYSAQYRQQYKKSFQPKPKHLYRETLRASARLRDFLPHYQAGMRVLDIGAGAGFFSYVLRAQGIDSDGIEPNEHYAEFARSQLGLASVRTGFLLDITQRDHYHLITINHVFEHLPEPRAALAHMHSLLTTGGRVLMENDKSLLHTKQGKAPATPESGADSLDFSHIGPGKRVATTPAPDAVRPRKKTRSTARGKADSAQKLPLITNSAHVAATQIASAVHPGRLQ